MTWALVVYGLFVLSKRDSSDLGITANVNLILYSWYCYILLLLPTTINPLYPLMTFYLLTGHALKFTGKGYRIFWTSRNSCAPSLGYSHFVLKYYFNLLPASISKYSYSVLGLGLFKLKSAPDVVSDLRPINPYTLRGFRLVRSNLYKRVGKVGAYF